MDRLELASSPPLQALNRHLDEAVADGLASSWQPYFKGLYNDDQLFGAAGTIIEDWTGSYSTTDPQPGLRQSWDAFINRGEVDTPEKETLGRLHIGRPDRWQRLSQATGIPVPETFRLFRGVTGLNQVEAVAYAWKKGKSLKAAARKLSSWSMNREIAFTKFANDPEASVLYDADVPFIKTLADRWVDDHDFLKMDECEVIVATERDNAIEVQADRVVVRFRGKTYRYDEKDLLSAAWEAAHGPIE